MPLQQTSGNDTSDAYGGGASVIPYYIEDVFSTWVYTGTGASQSIANGIDLSTKGGLVWIKSRSDATNNNLFDTAQGTTKSLHSNNTNAVATDSNSLTAFNTTGFTIGTGGTSGNEVNISSSTYVSWTFRKQPKFFDVVTYTGNGANRTIAHNLGSVPGCIIVKRTDASSGWYVYHRSIPNTDFVRLDSTDPSTTSAGVWNSTSATSTVFSVGTAANSVNTSGGTYVAYLFAHNAGGFGLTGTDNVITCGSFTTDGSSTFSVTLGYEPQWVMIKASSTTGPWYMVDSMRGFITTGVDNVLYANLSSAEGATGVAYPTATGFAGTGQLNVSQTFIYIAIRRGPMKTPTTGTSVFSTTYLAGDNGTSRAVSAGFAPDLFVFKRVTTGDPAAWADKLRGPSIQLDSTSAATEVNQSSAGTAALQSFSNTGIVVTNAGTNINTNATGYSYGYYSFQRAPGFFDEVCYTGNAGGVGGPTQDIPHNLGVAPELYIVKARNLAQDWIVGSSLFTATSGMNLNLTGALVDNSVTARYWNGYPTSTNLKLGNSGLTNENTYNFVAYLFATCAGVSKVGKYTGTGASQVINCGFTSGARFVMIKRTDTNGGWYIYDTARGMVSGTDNYFFMNTTAAQVNADYVFTSSTGFTIQAAAPVGINASGGTYLFLAIA